MKLRTFVLNIEKLSSGLFFLNKMFSSCFETNTFFNILTIETEFSPDLNIIVLLQLFYFINILLKYFMIIILQYYK